MVARLHKDVLFRMRAFWQLLMHAKVRFEDLTRASKDMDTAIRQADQAYR